MDDIKVSIIVPVYNTEIYLKECLESLVNQSLKNIEIIIVNDGSTDKSSLIINEYSKKYKNIIVINTNNVGVGAARNLGIKKASGEYIAFVDSDDFIEKEMYEVLYKIANNTDSDIVISGINFYYENLEEFNDNKFENEIKYYYRKDILQNFFMGNVSTYSWNKMYKRDIFCMNNLNYSEDTSTGEDIIVAIKAINLCTKVARINNKLYNYRQREGSITHIYSKDKIADNNRMIAACITYAKENIKDIDKDYIIYYEFKNLISMFIEYVKIMNFNRFNIYNNFKNVFGDLGSEILFKDILKSSNLKIGDKIRYILFKMKILDIYIFFRLNRRIFKI